MNVYGGFIQARTTTPTKEIVATRAVVITAVSDDAANGRVYRSLDREFPTSEGWHNREFQLVKLRQDLLDELRGV